MKKIIALILAAVMVLALAACGEESSSESSSSASASSETSESASPSNSEESGASESKGTTFEPMELKYTTIHNQGDASVMDDYFMNYITEATDGAITWQVFYGGTFCATNEELDNLQAGSVDVAALNALPYGNVLTTLQYPRYTCTGYNGTVDYAKEILFNNAETSSLIQTQMEDNGIHVIGVGIMTNDGYECKSEVDSIQDLKGKLFGTGTAGALEEEYGLNVVFTAGADAYDSLSRGVVDCVGLPISDACNYSLYEVSTCWLYYNRIGMNNFYSINLDTWNSFSPELQEVFAEAGKEMIDYSAEYNENYENELVDLAESNGVTVKYVDDDEYAYNDFSINATNALETAQGAGDVEAMKTIVSVAADFLGFDVTDILNKY